ncbi:hypothetical protein BRADI_2g60543v3 [Brachypodium distachyon]|uniref:Uncharacterized protein n=1 Tax=Brachypodium distachyon TaxID=15368 RepID=A0A0Q3GM16_BRADI|nr:hypothetical protein BRADI_2g60543v3 [Brachypodium distachyon]
MPPLPQVSITCAPPLAGGQPVSGHTLPELPPLPLLPPPSTPPTRPQIRRARQGHKRGGRRRQPRAVEPWFVLDDVKLW